MTTKRSVTPHHRMGSHGYSKTCASGSIHARRCLCCVCPWTGLRVDAELSCPHCGGETIIASPDVPRRVKQRPTVLVGTRDPIEEAETDRRLREAREEAGR